MKQETARKLWLVWASGLLYLMFNSVAAAQGWPFKLPGLAFEAWDRYAVAMVAMPVGLVGLTVLAVLGTAHARDSGGGPLHRLPPPFGLADPDSLLLHAAQLFAFVLLPLAATASLSAKFLSGIHCRQVADAAASGCGKSGYAFVDERPFAFMPWRAATGSGNYIYQGGPDYWPFWEPVLFAVLWVVAVVALAVFARAVLAPGRSLDG